jgi:hypothetical protein
MAMAVIGHDARRASLAHGNACGMAQMWMTDGMPGA